MANRCIVRSMMKSRRLSMFFAFFAGAARCLNGLAAGEYLEGHTSMIRRDPLGGRGFYRTVELSADDGSVETGSGAGGRELRSA